MVKYLVVAAFVAAPFVLGAPEPLEPSSTSVFNEGQNCTLSWNADTTGVWKTMNIELMTGSNGSAGDEPQVHLRTIATVDGTDPNNNSFSYKCLAVEPNSAIYFYRFSSPATSDLYFTTRFTIADATGNTVPPTETETGPNGEVIHWGTGHLEDATLVDQPPIVGTGSPSSGTITSTTSQTSTSTRSATSTSSTSTTSQASAGVAQTQPFAALVLGSLAALFGAFFV